MKKIVVVGGGTAGWLTALFCRRNLPGVEVTLIESSEIGILGAGEGTTPHFVSFLMDLGLPLNDLFKYTSATVKNGILFTNWNGDGTSFFHPFFDEDTLINRPYFIGKRISQKQNLDNLIPSYFVSTYKKVKFFSNEVSPIAHQWGNCAVHFDARKLADYLKLKGQELGIVVIDSKVANINSGETGNIESIDLENGESIASDFVFDCTGFKRLIIGKYYQSEWVSYKESIPNNKAMPFFIPQEKDEILPPYTEAIAMKYGWVWKIPVQGRYGCGYVFDSSSATDEEIVSEINEKFGPVEIPRSFNFEPGTFKEIWKGNCIATGLASGFIEPLEATSIWVTILTLQKFLMHITGATENNKKAKDAFNETVYRINEEILTFIYFHYITQRKDTPYWESFSATNKAPELFEKISRRKDYIDFDDMVDILPNSFERSSVLAVGAGGYFFTEEAGRNLMHTYEFSKKIDHQKVYLENTTVVINKFIKCTAHMDLIKHARGS
jgi:tryptophan halogenase